MILENIRRQVKKKPVRQRDLASIVGISLGMTNVIIKKLAQKGWVKIRKINNRNISYAVTPAGIEEIAHRSFTFFKRTVKNVVFYKDVLEEYLRNVRNSGCRGILLVGESDFDFIIAHLCHKQGIEYAQSKTDDPREGYFSLYCEDAKPRRSQSDTPLGTQTAYLQEILVNR
jgi:DNA-binding MarR family transcriptional regulator